MHWTSEDRTRVFRKDTLDAYKGGVESSIQLMYDKLGDDLTIDDLADAAFMSRFHFTRVFLKISGVSPARFLAAIRIQEAKRLLLKTDRSVTDVSLDVGYNSLGTFSRIFTDFVGFPPVRFRQLSSAILSLTIDEVVRFLPLHSSALSSPTITGEVVYDGSLALVAVALFPAAIPRSNPIECACLTESRQFEFTSRPPDGARIFAAGILPTASMDDAILLSHEHVRVGVAFSSPAPNSAVVVKLDPWRRTDPPVVIAFPLFLVERYSRSNLSTPGEENYEL